MISEETIVTIVGSSLAKEGADFVYCGPAPECQSCKVFKVCHNTKLRAGRRYTVVAVRPAKHACLLHEDSALAVNVVDADIEILLPADKEKSRTRIVYESFCDEEYCRYYPLCHPAGVSNGVKYIVKETSDFEEELPCGRTDFKRAVVTSLPL